MKVTAFTIMIKDIEVLKVDFESRLFVIVNEKYLPWRLRGKLKDTRFESGDDVIKNNVRCVRAWLASRVLPLDREHSKKIYAELGFNKSQSDDNKSDIALVCKALTLQDNFWARPEGCELTWKDVNLRKNGFNRALSQLALHGHSYYDIGDLQSAELSTDGTSAKAWKLENGKMWLYKAGESNSELEVTVSLLLDKMNVEHVKYYKAASYGLQCSKCKCMTTDDVSILTATEFSLYCFTSGLDMNTEAALIDSKNYYKMWIVDYLISNSDRHTGNWGFFYNSDSMEIIGCHPLFDHNKAFNNVWMQYPNVKYQCCGLEIQEAARRAVELTDFQFKGDYLVGDFICEGHYDSFMKRAEGLGLA